MRKPVIGLEVHCQLKTNSKVFSSGKNDYNEEANINLSVVDLAFPGTLPVLNKEAVRKAIKVALALNCEIPEIIVFDRKNYFYPDLPKGFQITQNAHPFGTNGYLMINVNGEDKKILIHDLHLEEDTASLDHFENCSLINYNRAGIPLIEIVTEPCLNSADEVISYLESLRNLIRYCDASEARSDRGQMRCDVNISLTEENSDTFGTKVEIKNINSFYNVRETIEYEIKRQNELLDKGEFIKQETRRFDAETHTTISMRSKEDSVDYKYFVEPNIPEMKLERKLVLQIKNDIPKLEYERINDYVNSYKLSRYDSEILVKERDIADYFEECVNLGSDPKSVANWIITKILSIMNKENKSINDIFLRPSMLHELISLVDNKEISSQQAKDVFSLIFEKEKTPKEIVKELGIEQIKDDSLISNYAKEVINENQQGLDDYLNGKEKMLDYLVGQIMKKSKGQANPTVAKEILINEIKKH